MQRRAGSTLQRNLAQKGTRMLYFNVPSIVMNQNHVVHSQSQVSHVISEEKENLHGKRSQEKREGTLGETELRIPVMGRGQCRVWGQELFRYQQVALSTQIFDQDSSSLEAVAVFTTCLFSSLLLLTVLTSFPTPHLFSRSSPSSDLPGWLPGS